MRAVGPTAQDFHAAFGLGNDDKTIVGTNLHGVALAAVQGLHEIVQAQRSADAGRCLRTRTIRSGRRSRNDALRERTRGARGMRGEMSSIQATLRALRDAPLRHRQPIPMPLHTDGQSGSMA